MSRSSSRRGFTLVEVTVALLLLCAGLLAAASCAAALVRLIAAAARDARSASVGESLLDSLLTVPCAPPAAGSASAPALLLRWSRDAAGATVSVTPARADAPPLLLRRARACAR